MKFRKFFCGAILFAAAVAGGTGCKTTYSGSFMLPETRETFPEIENACLTLEQFGPRNFLTDIKKDVQFRLTNVGRATIVIDEWYRSEARNITLYYQDWTPNMKDPDPRLWMVSKPYIPAQAVRAPMTLSPRVSAMIRVPLSFLDGVKVTEGYERRFFVRAELNLMSVKASSPIFVVTLM